MITKNENPFTGDNTERKCSLPKLTNYYEKKLNHYIRNNLQVIISLIDMYSYILEKEYIGIDVFEMLQSQIRSFISVYDLKKGCSFKETINLLDLFSWFRDYFEENVLFKNNRFIFTITGPVDIHIPFQNSQHFALFIHELYVQMYTLMDKYHTMNTKLFITANDSEKITITIDFRPTEKRIEKLEFPIMLDEPTVPQFKINKELFQLLLEQLKGQIIVNSVDTIIKINISLLS